MGLGRLRHAQAVVTLAQAALAPSTARAYAATWRLFGLFLRKSITDIFPTTTAEVADFLGQRFEAGCGSASLASYCSAIAFGHRMRGIPDPTSDFRIRRLLAGARRLRPSADVRVAITITELDRLRAAAASLPLPPVAKAAFRAIFSLAFFAMLRPGEILVGGEPSHTIRLGHITIQGNRLWLTIPSSKTSSVPFTTVLIARPDLPSCPVRAVQQYLRVRPQGGPHDFFFISDSARPITTRSLTRVLRLAGRVAHMDTRRLAGHCFRIGGASQGAQQGLSELQLCESGRWSSTAFRRYLRRPVSILQRAPATVDTFDRVTPHVPSRSGRSAQNHVPSRGLR